MGIIIICAVIAIIYILVEMGLDFVEPGEVILYGISGGLIGLIVYCCFGGVIGANFATVEEVTEQEIFALTDSSTIEGYHFLYSGQIDGDLVYRYVIETEKGKHIEEISAEHAYIKEGDYTPTVKIHDIKFAKDWYSWFAYDFLFDDYVEFYIPENTITTEYNIDLK